MKVIRILVGSVLVLSVVLVAVLARGGDSWPCKEFLYAHGDPVGGYRSEDLALSAGADQLETMGLSKEQVDAARLALPRQDGDDRYVEGGKLFLDNVLVAQFEADRLADGSFVVSSWKTCAPPAEDGEPTPSSGHS